MNDLISRKRIEFELCESNMPKRYRDFCRRVINSESLSPSVDAVEVVRCKDCKHQVTELCVGGTYQACDHEDHEGADGCYPHIISQDWFCADGERKEVSE